MSGLEDWLQTVGDITGRPGLFVIEPEISGLTRFPARFILPYIQTWGLNDHAEMKNSNPYYKSLVQKSSRHLERAEPYLDSGAKTVYVDEDWGEIRVAVDADSNEIFLLEVRVIIDKARERLNTWPVILYRDIPSEGGFCWLDPKAGEYASFSDSSFTSLADLGSVGLRNRDKAKQLIPEREAAKENALRVFRQAAAVAKEVCLTKGLEPTLVHVFSKRGLYLRFKNDADERVVEEIEKNKGFRDAVEEGQRYSTRADQIENDLRDHAWTLATLYLNNRKGVVHVRTAFPPKQRIPLAIGPPAYAVMESLLNKRGAWIEGPDNRWHWQKEVRGRGGLTIQVRPEGLVPNILSPESEPEPILIPPGDLTNPQALEIVDIAAILLSLATLVERPWEDSVTINAKNLLKPLGLEERKDLSEAEKLKMVIDRLRYAAAFYVAVPAWRLDSKGEEVASVTLSQWFIPEFTILGKTGEIKETTEVLVKISPGPWTKVWLNRESGAYLVGNIDRKVLESSSYREPMAKTLAYLLEMQSNFHLSAGNSLPIKRNVGGLFENAAGSKGQLDLIGTDKNHRRRWVDTWDKTLVKWAEEGWEVSFDDNYPMTLRPKELGGTGEKRPREYWQSILDADVFLSPPGLKAEVKEKQARRKDSQKRRQQQRRESKPVLTGDEIKKARLAAGLSVRGLATKVEISHKRLLKLEQGLGTMDAELNTKLRKVLGVKSSGTTGR